MKRDCVDHLNFMGETCPDCGLEVNEYGNTEAQPIDYCQFPHCGCDGARLCMAKEGPSDYACEGNVEGMWEGSSPNQVRARSELILRVMKEDKQEGSQS